MPRGVNNGLHGSEPASTEVASFKSQKVVMAAETIVIPRSRSWAHPVGDCRSFIYRALFVSFPGFKKDTLGRGWFPGVKCGR